MNIKSFPYHGCEDKTFKYFIDKVLKGEYDTSITDFSTTPVVLDLGANIGSYSYYIINKYKDVFVIAFEPSPKNCENYLKNIRESGILESRFKLIRSAVYPEGDSIIIYESPTNCGMNSIHKSLANSDGSIQYNVPVTHPRDLPDCSILKMDTEGCEVQILKSYFETHKNRPAVVSFEFHSFMDRYELDNILGDDYILHTGKIIHHTIGTLNYLHKSVIEHENDYKLTDATYSELKDL